MNSQLHELIWPEHSVLKRMSQVLAPLQVAASVVNAKGYFLYTNPEFCRLFQCGPEEMRTKRFVDLSENHDTYKSLMVYDQLFHVIENMDLSWSARTRAGRPFPAAGHLFRVVSPKGDRYVIALIAEDDTARKGRRQIGMNKHMVDLKLRLASMRGAGSRNGADVLKSFLDHVVSEAQDRFNIAPDKKSQVDLVSLEYLQTLGRVAEMRDSETGGHMNRIGLISYLIGREMGLSESERLAIAAFAPLHDIGKIGIPDSILHAPRKLTNEEWSTMRTHTTLGEQIFSGYPSMGYAAQIAGAHHERYDGKGYPRGVYRNQIPFPARITAVADVYDAIRSKRPYKPPLPHDQAIVELREGAGSHFDPDVVYTFLQIADDIGHGYDETPMFHGTIDAIEDMDVRSLFLMTLE